METFLNCDERKDLILLYAGDALDAPEQTELRAHLMSGCPQCSGSLAEAQAVLGLLPLALPAEAPPTSAGATLMSKIKTKGSGRSPTLRRLAIAACVGALVSAAFFWMTVKEDLRLINSSDVRPVSLLGAAPQPKAHGRIFWDLDRKTWHVYVFDLQPPPAGREYELWFITPDQRKIAAGSFKVNDKGKASFAIPVPQNLTEIALAAVTDEPAGVAHVQPTGTIQLVGEVKK